MAQLLDCAANKGMAAAVNAGPLAAEMDLAKTNLESKMFEVLKTEVEYDMKAYEVHMQNRITFNVNIRNAELGWQKKCLEEARNAVEAYWVRNATWQRFCQCS